MTRPKLLDLFCGAGGASMGYHQAGFEVTGIDINPQQHYPFCFIRGDAMTYPLEGYDIIHASPPCQAYSRLRHLPWLRDKEYPRLLEPCLRRLSAWGKPFIVENVEGSALDGIVLCGVQFGLPLYRHRRFASNILILQPDHVKHTHVICHGRGNMAKRYHQGGDVMGTWSGVSAAEAMGINWMTRHELTQAIPPAYTHFIGSQLR